MLGSSKHIADSKRARYEICGSGFHGREAKGEISDNKQHRLYSRTQDFYFSESGEMVLIVSVKASHVV